ncbi:DNA-processing protein DprA [Desulfovibrio inopinatus]|uniref:DNA-processing protein DprA n=1 Tax=Desulfovibrio inopinatus TaxID=102109 RepID=UPI0003FE0555|nr:DNA-processing protein DprA [Desulfovibrio inopinatus]
MTDDDVHEFWACLTLKHTQGMGPRTWRKILTFYETARNATAHVRSWSKDAVVSDRQLQAYLAESWRHGAEKEFEAAKRSRLPVMTWGHSKYPDHLKQIPDPPALLYYVGDVSLLNNPGVAVVGARDCTEYGLDATARIGRMLSDAGVTVVSGLAFGIDRQAHIAGLQGIGSSIAVVATGLDLVYPAQNMDVWKDLSAAGLVISEFAPGTKPTAANFPIRNRIISGLSLAVLVVEAAKKSGSLITARLAMEQGREVYALPGPYGLETYGGCHAIINSGARLFESVDAMLLELAPLLEAYLDYPQRRAALIASRPSRELQTVRRAPSKKQKPGIEQSRRDIRPTASKDSRADLQSLDISKQNIAPEVSKTVELSEQESQLMELLVDDDKVHIDTLGRSLAWDSSQVSSILLVLEVRGIVQKWPGMFYSRIVE